MGRVKTNPDCENDILHARKYYLAGIEPSIRAAAATYGLPYTTLYDRLQGAQSRTEAHRPQQLLTEQEEKSIVRFCTALNDLGHPITM
jgi:hypothetical protein